MNREIETPEQTLLKKLDVGCRQFSGLPERKELGAGHVALGAVAGVAGQNRVVVGPNTKAAFWNVVVDSCGERSENAGDRRETATIDALAAKEFVEGADFHLLSTFNHVLVKIPVPGNMSSNRSPRSAPSN